MRCRRCLALCDLDIGPVLDDDRLPRPITFEIEARQTCPICGTGEPYSELDAATLRRAVDQVRATRT